MDFVERIGRRLPGEGVPPVRRVERAPHQARDDSDDARERQAPERREPPATPEDDGLPHIDVRA